MVPLCVLQAKISAPDPRKTRAPFAACRLRPAAQPALLLSVGHSTPDPRGASSRASVTAEVAHGITHGVPWPLSQAPPPGETPQS